MLDTGQPNRSAQAPVSSSGFQTFTILSVTDARTGEDLTVAEAVRRGILDSSKRNYRDTLAGEVMLLDTAVKRSELLTVVLSLSPKKIVVAGIFRLLN